MGRLTPFPGQTKRGRIMSSGLRWVSRIISRNLSSFLNLLGLYDGNFIGILRRKKTELSSNPKFAHYLQYFKLFVYKGNEAPRPCLPAGKHRTGLPGNVDLMIGSAFLPAYKAGHQADLPARGDFRIDGLFGGFTLLRRKPRLRAVTPVCRQAGTSECRHGLSDCG